MKSGDPNVDVTVVRCAFHINNNCVYPGTDGRDLFAQSKLAMGAFPLWYRTFFKDLLADEAVAFVPNPKDPDSDAYYIQEQFGGYYIPTGAKTPEGAAAWLCCQRFSRLDTKKQQEDFEAVKNECNWTRECQDMLDSMQTDAYKPVQSTWVTFGINAFWGDIFSRPKQGEPWATIAEELSPKIDANIKTAMSAE